MSSSRAISEALAASEQQEEVLELGGDGQWWYCLDKQHSKDLVSTHRLFRYDGGGCPVCPVCKTGKGEPKAVAANPVEFRAGKPVVPGYLIALDQRLNPE